MASSGRRAFAQKLNKNLQAADIRRQISGQTTPNSISRASSISNVSVIHPQMASLSEIVDPPDYEVYLEKHHYRIQSDDCPQLLKYPDDDIEVSIIPRKCRTVKPALPDEEQLVTDLQVRDCLKLYTSEWAVVNRKYKSKVAGHEKTKLKRIQSDLIANNDKVFEVDELELIDEDELQEEEIKRGSIHMERTPRGSWASNIFNLESTEADDLLPNLLDHAPIDQQDRINMEARNTARNSDIFTLYPAMDDEDAIERRSLVDIPAEHFGSRLLVKCLQLKLELEIEPIFATMALYDSKEKKKISENFYFDMNTDAIKGMIVNKSSYPDVSTMARAAVFSLTYPSSDVYIVVKLDKVLQQGDIQECAEPYMKESENPKVQEKVKANAKYFCEKLGAYRMPFAWTAIDLMNVINGSQGLAKPENTETAKTSASSLLKRQSFNLGLLDPFSRTNSLEDQARKKSSSTLPNYNSLPRKGSDAPSSLKRSSSDRRSFYRGDDEMTNLNSFKPVTLTVSSFFKQEGDKLSDDDLYKFLADLKRPTSILKRLKCIPGSLKLDISKLQEMSSYCLTPDLYQVKPYPDLRTRPTREIQEFPSRDVYVPNNVYRNIIYVYPLSLNFSGRTGSARNIAIKVQLLKGSGEDDCIPFQCIFGKSSGPELVHEMYTSVTYHNKTPDFYEEIKIRLPPSLEDSNHLLFTMYHISCQKKQDNTQVETPIGYTWLPIYRNHRLQTGDFHLPVSVEKLPKAYSMLSADTQLPYMKWIDGQKAIFNVSVKAVSAIHTQDEKLDQFLWLCHSIEAGIIPKSIPNERMEFELNKSVLSISEALAEPLVQFLHLLLDKLFLMMVKSPVLSGQLVNMSSNCFESLAYIVDRIHNLLDKSQDNHGRNSLLAAYIQYVFKPPEDVPRPAGMSPSGSYSSLKKSHSMTLKSSTGNRNTYGGISSVPQSPDDEVSGIMHTKISPDRYGSAKAVQQNAETGMGNVPVRGLGGRSPPRKLVHEQLALQLGICNGRSKDFALKHTWFFLDLMVKSMAQFYYSEEYQLKDVPRKERFSDSFDSDIEAIVVMVATEVLARHTKETRAMGLLNVHLAFFLQDLFTLMDRGFVFKQIQCYCKMLAERLVTLTDPTPLAQIKLEFLRIVCSHEHYVTLNLPLCPSLITAPPSPTLSIASTLSFCSVSSFFPFGDMHSNTKAELSYEFRQRHFLTGLVLSDLSAMLLTNNNNNHRQAIDIVANLLASHDCDPRYKDVTTRMRVASLYLPLLDIIMDAIPQFNCTNANPKQRPSFMFGMAEEDDDSVGLGINKSVALAIAGTSVATMAEDTSIGSVQRQSSSTRMTEESTKDLLLCAMWVMKNVEAASLQKWWSALGVQRFIQVLDVLFYCACCFEYKGKTSIIKKLSRTSMKKTNDIKQRLEDAILGSASARSEFIMRRSGMYSSLDRTASGPALGQSERVRWRKDLTHFRQTNEILESKSKTELEDDAVLEGCLATEVSLTILDTLELIIQSIQTKENLSGVLSSVMQVLLHMLQCNQSVVVLKNALATQRSLVFKYPGLLFEDETEQCADLCLRILKHCSSCIDTVRSHASASLYLLMRQNFEIGNNFARVKMQVTMSLSHLVGTVTNFHEGYLRKSLKTILMYADEDIELKATTFPEQVHNLVFNLHMILSDTVKMKEFKEDPEMLMDLMYRIAKGYQDSPDLRLTWLQNMAGQHMRQGNHVESAMCLIHCAGLVTEYLHMQEDRPYLPVGCVAFEKISSNVLEESAVSDDVVSPDEEGICSGKYFTESGLVGLLEQAATFFTEGGFYEVVNEVYKVLIPIHENNRNYNRLSTIHSKLCDAFHKIVELDKKRMFGTYFRVGYYGPKFGDLDGEEFIYKEPKITKLPEIAHRLQNFYGERFGEENLVMMKDSRKVDVRTLDPLKAYIQVTYVEPYFQAFENDFRRTHFDKSYNLRRFVFATPFTEDGRAHGELHEQYKRKTILTTSHAFPYVKTRCTIIHKEEIVLKPIEVAIEDMQKKMTELAQATIQDPPDPKFLQMVLQGCIGTTVNQGPFEVAQVFLGDKAAAEIPLDKEHNKLRICFKEFSKRCSDALRKNKTLIASDQKEYQKELERNYHRFTDRLTPLIANRDPVNTSYYCNTIDYQSIHV
ncbi:dedicator of cytokinesis protein 7-like isoform X2 [Anneissia japonica]|uniref:dedicator of cytokinesis protein 7-like isoform X2 n=1 Tax=Anneissia japonica TaxID=1529436 RepID=UPI0014258E8C|nr:dedicator of cytokinesis protein 7-like isoform X2 [Anneissia japonica]